MNIYYVNSDHTLKIDFNGPTYEIADMDLFQHEFKYISENDKIKEFKKNDVITREIVINVCQTEYTTWQKSYEDMQDVFERDIFMNHPGKLYIDNYYLNCFFYAGQPEDPFMDDGFKVVKMKIVSDYPRWIKEQKFEFGTSGKESQGNLRFPYKFPYRFAIGLNQKDIINNNVIPSDFILKIIGPAVNPQITIGGNRYQVFITLEAGEYLEIDSQTETIKKILTDGEEENAFHYREKSRLFFKKIDPGRQHLAFTKKISFELTIFEERSEPRWEH